MTVGGLSFHALNAGHVLGACMFWLELGGRSILVSRTILAPKPVLCTGSDRFVFLDSPDAYFLFVHSSYS